MDSVTPVSNARVSLLSEADGTARGIITDPGGFFLFDHLGVGKYRLTAEASSGHAPLQEIVLNDNQRIEGVVLNIRGGAMIRGKVTGTLPTEQKTVNFAVSGPGGFSTFISTNFEGAYAISGVPAGTIQLLASTSKFRSMSLSVVVPTGVQELTFDIEFPQNARLHGRVMKEGKPVPFADVFVIPAEPQMVRGSTKTDEEGRYEIDGLGDGRYTIEIAGAGTKNVSISGDAILDIELSGAN